MVQTTNLISYYKFDESSGNAADAHGPNTLTNNGTATFAAAIINNGADIEAGSTQSFSIADASQTGLDVGTNDFSMSVWFKPESAPSGTSYTLMAKYDSGDAAVGWTWDYNDNAGTKRLRAVMGAANTATTINQTLDAGTWYHIVYAYDNSAGTIDVYLNGSSIGQMTGQVSGASLSTAAPFCIGQISPDNNNYLDGMVDEAGIWVGYLLTSSDASELYNGGAGLAYPFTGAVATTIFPSRMMRGIGA